MYKRAPRSLTVPLTALLLAAPALSALAQTEIKRTETTVTIQSDANNGDWSPSACKSKVARMIADKQLTQTQLISILPLLQDLRDAKRSCDSQYDVIYTDYVVSKSGNVRLAADKRWNDCQRRLADRQRDIWNIIDKKIGSDSAMAFRAFVEPKTEDVSKLAYTDVHLQRIDQYFVELDKATAARIAANGGKPEEAGVRPAAVETVTTVTTTTMNPFSPLYVNTPAIISEADLVKVVEERIVADEVGHSDYIIYMPMNRDLTNQDLVYMRDCRWNIW